MESAPPVATLTFLFTDIEGSTRLIQELGTGYPALLDRHRVLIDEAVRSEGGQTFGSEGDAQFTRFESAAAAVRAAVAAQRALAREPWPAGRDVRVRMGVHTGPVTRLGDDYVGLPLHQVARITSAAHGGQVLVSEGTRTLAAAEADAAGIAFLDLGTHRLKDLAHDLRLFQVLADGLRREFPPPRSLGGRPNNLPLQLTTFVGRTEIETARDLLGRTRLLTLTGPGGTGKTRLALQVAAESLDAFPDGAFFVALDTVTDPALVPSAVAAALSLLDASGAPLVPRIVDHLRPRELLLVLDNFEQIVDAAPLVAELLREAPGVKVLVTSRIPLRLSGEQELPVPPLVVPAGDASTAERAMEAEAVRLFVERAMAAQPSFHLTDANAATVTEIVRRLDGLPLAIELAAARLRILPLEALRARLDQALSVLVSGPRDRPERQQTLRGAIDWSYELLDEPDRRLFARFSVFVGGAGLREAETVCGPATELQRDVLEGLTSLAEKSLLKVELSGGEEPRFGALVTIREYAAERLEASGETAELRRRHAQAYLGVVVETGGALTGRGSLEWLDRLELDHDNLRAALDELVAAGDAESALTFVAGVWRFWQIRGHLHEAAGRATRVLAMPGVATAPPELAARAFGAAGSIDYWRADFRSAYARYDKALELARAGDDRRVLAEALYNASFVPIEEFSNDVERYTKGLPLAREAEALFASIGDIAGMAGASWSVALASIALDDLAGGRAAAERSLELFRQIGDSFGIGWALHVLGLLDLREGHGEAGEARFVEAMQVFAPSRDRSALVILFADFSLVAERAGDRRRAALLAGAAERLRRETGVDLLNAPIRNLEWEWEDHHPTNPEEEAWVLEGERMSDAEAIAYALRASPGAAPEDSPEAAPA